MKLIAPWGFYGWGNIGDEGTLRGFARLAALARQQGPVWVASQQPRHTARVEPSFRYFSPERRDWRHWLANRKPDAMVVPGGTPIQDSLGEWPFCDLVPMLDAAQAKRMPCVFVGTGTERLTRPDSNRAMAERFAPQVLHWTVRSEADEQRLRGHGVAAERITVAGDMAWLLPPASPQWGKEQFESWGVPTTAPIVAVNIMNERVVRERHAGLFAALARCLDTLIERRDAFVLFVAQAVNEQVGFDRSASVWTLGAMRHRARAFLVPNVYWPPENLMSLLANCHASISMRYHFCLFSALQGVPFVALQRSDKVADLCTDLDWPLGVSLADASDGNLLEAFDTLQRERPRLCAKLAARVPAMSERAARNVKAFDRLRDAHD